MRIRIDATPALNGTLLDSVRRIARTPIGQLVTERRALIEQLRLAKFSPTVTRQLLRLSHQQVSEAGLSADPRDLIASPPAVK